MNQPSGCIPNHTSSTMAERAGNPGSPAAAPRRPQPAPAGSWFPTTSPKPIIIVTGHTHEVVNELREGRLMLNPGEYCGWVTGRSTIAVLDTDAFSANIVELTP